MTKGVFIELVYQMVNGGRPTTDSSIMRVDIEAYLPACVNYALTKGYFLQVQTEGNRELPTMFFTHFRNLEIRKETFGKNRRYIDLPASLIALPSNRALRMVTDNCDNVYIPLKENHLSNLDYWLNILSDERFYRPIEKKVYLYNEPGIAESANVVMIVSVHDLADTAELPIPAGQEEEALTMCYRFVTGQLNIPTDKINDSRSINSN